MAVALRTTPAPIPARFLERAARHGSRPAIRVLAAGGAPEDRVLTWGDWAAASKRFAAALVAAGHGPGTRVAILAQNTPVWPVADLGGLLAGAVTVGVYPTSAPAQVRQVLADCEAAVLVVDTLEQLSKVRAVADSLPALRTVVCAEPDAGAGEPPVLGWADWLERGAAALAEPAGAVAAEVARRARAADPDDVAILIYTSGSTGEPKGAALSHRYLAASAASIQEVLDLTDADTSLAFLPFCHAAERIFGLYTRIHCGMEAGLVRDHRRLGEAAAAYRPTTFGAVPHFFEKAYETLDAERDRAGAAERERWDRTLELGRTRSRLRRDGTPVPPDLEAEWRTLGEPFIRRLSGRFGGRVRRATSGGAALPAEAAEFLDALGMTVLGAYGLTEHLCVAFNRPERYSFDTAGPPMPGTELRIAEDGEILVRRGALTFSGYHGRPEETRAAFTDDGEWLRTGDLGELDGRGFLRVLGRKKELIALSTGKKIAPLPIEARLQEDPWIAQAMLYGEGRKYITALLCLRRPVIEEWAARHGLPGDATRLEHPALLARVQAAVDRVNESLSRPERIRRFALLDRELSADDDELTPTLKLRRSVVAERFRDRLEALYR